MRVLCISNKNVCPMIINVIEGYKYTVIDTTHFMGDDYYRLQEHPFSIDGGKAWYWQENFIPISDIDETEMQEYKQNEHDKAYKQVQKLFKY